MTPKTPLSSEAAERTLSGSGTCRPRDHCCMIPPLYDRSSVDLQSTSHIQTPTTPQTPHPTRRPSGGTSARMTRVTALRDASRRPTVAELTAQHEAGEWGRWGQSRRGGRVRWTSTSPTRSKSPVRAGEFTTLASGSRGPDDYGDSARGAYRATPRPEIHILSSWALGGVHG